MQRKAKQPRASCKGHPIPPEARTLGGGAGCPRRDASGDRMTMPLAVETARPSPRAQLVGDVRLPRYRTKKKRQPLHAQRRRPLDRAPALPDPPPRPGWPDRQVRRRQSQVNAQAERLGACPASAASFHEWLQFSQQNKKVGNRAKLGPYSPAISSAGRDRCEVAAMFGATRAEPPTGGFFGAATAGVLPRLTGR
jgi:hypothetical protein